MDLAIIAFHQIMTMFIIMVIAIFLYKIKMIDDQANRTLSNMLLLVINPILLFISYQTDFNPKRVKGLAISFVLSLISMLIAIVIAYFMVPKTKKTDYLLERFSAIYSNCGFFGIPLVHSLFKTEGVFYLTAYMTVFSLFVWSHGIFMMTGKKSKKDALEVVKSPAVIAVLLGVICYFFRICLPETLLSPLEIIASMNTPFAMIIAGVAIAQSNILQIISKKRIYVVGFVKLLIIPAVLIFIFKFIPVDFTIKIIVIVATACPSATTGTMFAIRFHKDYKYASEIFAVTTLVSLITIPFIVYFSRMIS